MKRKSIAKYRTQAGAEVYACDLRKKWQGRIFEVMQHPHDFGYTVGFWAEDRWAYCEKRPAHLLSNVLKAQP